MNRYALLISLSLFCFPIASSHNDLHRAVSVFGGAATASTIICAGIGLILKPCDASVYYRLFGLGTLLGILTYGGAFYCIAKQQSLQSSMIAQTAASPGQQTTVNTPVSPASWIYNKNKNNDRNYED